MKKVLIYSICWMVLFLMFTPTSLAAGQAPVYRMTIRDTSANKVIASCALTGGEVSSTAALDEILHKLHRV